MTRQPARGRHNIVVGTDFSVAARHAVNRAIAVAKGNDAMVHLVHAMGRIPAAIKRRFGVSVPPTHPSLDALAKHVQAAGLRAHLHRLERGATQALRHVVHQVDADLLVVGTRGRTVAGLVLGSTAERTASGVRIPVLLARNPGRRRYREVFIAADVGTALEPAVAAAHFVAPDGHVSVVHAYEGEFENTLVLHNVDAGNLARYRAQARSRAAAALRVRLVGAGLDASALVLRHGDPRRVLPTTDKHALLVLARDDAMIRRALLGSITRAIVAEGEVDLLIV